MEDNILLQAIERYLDGTMLPAEKAYFEELRKNTPEIDQMVVEHSMFLHQMDLYSSRLDLKHALHSVHNKLLEQGDINEGGELDTKGKVIRIWNRYRKVTAIAACVGGAIALVISGLVSYISPVNNSKIEQLKGEIESIKVTQIYQDNKLNNVVSTLPKEKDAMKFTGSGSGFLIDGKGYLVTNAHVLKGSSFVSVYNKSGEFDANIIYRDEKRDIAILKINDKDFTPVKTLPYSIKRNSGDLGEEVFTLGYPKNDIVLNVGYLSSKTGFNGDSINFQIQMSANPGNSGGPVLNKNGEIIGILSSREKLAEGVTFAVKSKNIYKLMEELKEKEDSTVQKIKMPTSSSLKGMDRVAQIKEMEDCVFLIKAYNNK